MRSARWVPGRLLVLAGLLFSSVILSRAHVEAQELLVSLDSECPEASIAGEVETALGRPLGERARALEARVAMRRLDGRVRVVIGLERDGAHSERALVADDCAAALRATALVLALALDGDLGMSAASEDSATIAPELEEPVTSPMNMALEPTPPERVDESVSRRADDVRVSVMAGGLVDAGSLPDAHGGVRVGFGIGLGDDAVLRLEVDATYLGSARERSVAPGANVDLMLAYGTLRVGALFPIPSAALSFGGGLELIAGAASGTGVGVRVEETATVWLPWVAVRASAIAEVVVFGPLSLRASGALGVPLAIPVFVIDGVEGVRPASGIMGEGAVSVVLRLT